MKKQKKNNKGFTLVEVLAVICIIAVLMIVVAPAVQKAMHNAKAGISTINKKNLKDAAKEYATELMFCDEDALSSLNLKNCDSDKCLDTSAKTTITCDNAKAYLNSGFYVSIADLKKLNYFSDDSDNCKDLDSTKGGIFIKADTGYQFDGSTAKETNANATETVTVEINDTKLSCN